MIWEALSSFHDLWRAVLKGRVPSHRDGRWPVGRWGQSQGGGGQGASPLPVVLFTFWPRNTHIPGEANTKSNQSRQNRRGMQLEKKRGWEGQEWQERPGLWHRTPDSCRRSSQWTPGAGGGSRWQIRLWGEPQLKVKRVTYIQDVHLT